MDTEKKIGLFEKDASGNFILDKAAKVILLTALSRGALTEAELDTLNKRSFKGGIQIVFTQPQDLRERGLCQKGCAALEEACANCCFVSGCTFWQNYCSIEGRCHVNRG